MRRERLITVCSWCLRASCWHGEFFCDHAQTAGTVQRTARELNKLSLEDKHHYSKDTVERVCGASDYQPAGLSPRLREAISKGGAR